MIRRLTTLSAAFLAVLALPSTAHAAVTATVQSPGRDAVVMAPTELRVQVDRALLDPDVRQVALRISRDGTEGDPTARSVSLTCIAGCGSQTSTWGGVTFDPASGAPFRDAAVCNGRWYLQPSVDGGSFAAGSPVIVSAPASPATAVRVRIDGRDATLTWTRAPEPDVAGYRVERATDGGAWRAVASVSASTSRYVDQGLAPATYDYRVVTLRPDGRDARGGMAPCADTGADLTTLSASSRGRVTTPAPSPSPRPGGTGSTPGTGSGGSGDGSGTGGSAGGTDGGGTSGEQPGAGSPGQPSGSTDGTGSDGSTSDGGATQAPRSTTRTRIAPPPSARGSRLDADTSLPSQPQPEERYYGDGEGYSDELDYGDGAGVDGERDGVAIDELEGRGLGAVSIISERLLDPERILKPVAGGLVFLTFGLHLRRWLRESDG